MAGTINTSNYNFKKYAPNDTVSMLQTFNGNMDAIDKAIKDRANVETEQGASIVKLENGLSSTNNGLNSANQTISAVQVQVTTNTRNIQTANTEIDTLDSRVQALEDGGSAIQKLQFNLGKQPSSSFSSIYKQGTHVFGIAFFAYVGFQASDFLTISSCDNYALGGPTNYIKALVINGNLFGLNPNIGHVIGTTDTTFMTSSQDNSHDVAVAIYDGASTYIGVIGQTSWQHSRLSLTIDTTI